ncbi:MAG: exosome complex protein Rrp4 [Methanosarcinales archaeon]|nr:exosome complex protein Rrp4 [Methanosarcinales archaeon]
MDKKKIVIPGELLSDDPAMSGPGTYISGGKVFASVCGLLTLKGKLSVHPLSGPYMPKRNDLVIGYVTVVTSSNWIFDINCPYEGLLHVTEYPLRVPSEEMTQHFNIGDTVLLKVTDVNAEMKIELTYKDPVCKKLMKGRLFEVPFSKVSRIIGRAGGMISMLKDKTNCDIFVGGNGRVWMNGGSLDMDILMRALNKIKADARLPGLTDLTAAFIDEQYENAGMKSNGAAETKIAARHKRNNLVKPETQTIDPSDLSLKEPPRKEKRLKKARGKDSDENTAAASVQNEPALSAEPAVKKIPAGKARLTRPAMLSQAGCSCFKNVFFTHPPVLQSGEPDRKS